MMYYPNTALREREIFTNQPIIWTKELHDVAVNYTTTVSKLSMTHEAHSVSKEAVQCSD